MRKPTLRQVEAFKAFVETGSVSRAADILHVSQPAVSKLLNHLEEDVEMRLIDRSHGRMTVTEKGMRVYEEVDKVMSGLDQINQSIAMIRNEDRATLTVGITPGFPISLLVNATQEVLSQRPDVNLVYFVRSSEYIIHRILNRKIDVAIIAQKFDHPLLHFETFYSKPMVVAMAEDHALAKKEVVTIEDLAEGPFVPFVEGTETRRISDKLFSDAGVFPKTPVSVTTAPQVCAMVAAGLGTCIVSPLFAAGSMEGLKMRPLKPEHIMEIHVARSNYARDSQPIDILVDRLKKAVEGI
ncbi:MAG: LysR family transcriptional regulator [Pseudomonadota bacterium]